MLRIYLTGDLCLSSNGKLARGDRLPGRQGRLVFAYLVMERSGPVTRDALVDSLWPDQPPAAFDIALSAIVSKLRLLFAEIGLSRRTLTSLPSCYTLALPPDTWIDIDAAIESVHVAEAALRAAKSPAAYGPAAVACAILRRPFLPGVDGAWVEARRRALLKVRLRALDCLAAIHAINGEHGLARRAAEEAIELEPFREAGYRRLMLVHDAAGNGADAMRVYTELQQLLEVELDASPAPETRRLLELIASKSKILTRSSRDS